MSDLTKCYGILEGSELRVGNDMIERTWRFSEGTPVCVCLRDARRDIEWIEPAPFPSSFLRTDFPTGERPDVSMELLDGRVPGTEETHLLVRVLLKYRGGQIEWEHRLWPDMPLILTALAYRRTQEQGTAVSPEAFFDDGRRHLYPVDDRLDFFGLKPFHLRFKSAAFFDRTDHHDNLVVERSGLTYPKENIRLQGNYLHLSDRIVRAGLLVLKLGPSPVGHLHYSGFDFSLSGRCLAVVGSGIRPDELVPGATVQAYSFAVAVTDGSDREGESLCKRLQRKRWPVRPERDFSVLENTWGDRDSGKQLSEKMMIGEIRAVARAGLSHSQIDAGWHRGSFAQLAVESSRNRRGPYDLDPDFWRIDETKFPRGFEPIVDLAREKNVRLGLWFCPDVSDEYAGWQRDAATIVGFWRRYGFDNIKIDGVHITSKRAEANFLRLLAEVDRQSGGAICINLDLTAGQRTGFFHGNDRVGTIFLENRYTKSRSYFPYRTLRNLWQLSRYLPTYRFQVEFLNPERNADLYGEDPLAPAAHGIEYCFAVTMMANPLCWMETSLLSREQIVRLKRAVCRYRQHQKEMLCGTVYPIGEEPDGMSWTGFQSVTAPGRGYLLVFREWTDRRTGRFRLNELRPFSCLRLERIAGRARLRRLMLDGGCGTALSLPAPRSFALLKYSVD